MQNQQVFQEVQERGRLSVQNRLLIPQEEATLHRLLSKRSGIIVLDIGCNDGEKTAELFSSEKIARVVGLEYNEDLVRIARERCGNGKFSFYHCDVEQADSWDRIREIMDQEQIHRFDLIYLSCVLMHLKRPEWVLAQVQSVLAPGGSLMIIEADDSATSVSPIGQPVLEQFMKILEQDPLSGNRNVGDRLPEVLKAYGYCNIETAAKNITAQPGVPSAKADIFDTFFSYLPEDVAILRKKEPANETYRAWEDWVNNSYEELKQAVLHPSSTVSIGVRVFTCQKKHASEIAIRNEKETYLLRPLTTETVDAALSLCDEYVGENLYSRDELAEVVDSAERFFYFLTSKENACIGYIYFGMTSAEDLARNTALGMDRLTALGMRPEDRIAKPQSIGIAAQYRKHGLAVSMMQVALDTLYRQGAAWACGICWRAGDIVPMESTMLELGFNYLCDIEKFWYQNEQLYCPHCNGRCLCSAAVYYKPLSKE